MTLIANLGMALLGGSKFTTDIPANHVLAVAELEPGLDIGVSQLTTSFQEPCSYAGNCHEVLIRRWDNPSGIS
jgi:hypothetical protein